MKPLSIRISEEERKIIESNAKESGQSVSQYCRDVLLKGQVSDDLPRQKIGRTLCIYHNKVEDAEDMSEIKYITHEMERELWQIIK